MGLLRPAWNSNYQKRAINAISKLSDQATLALAAKKAWRLDVREAAVQKLTDQTLLSDIAKNAGGESVRIEAAKRITDEKLFLDLIQYLGADLKKRHSQDTADFLMAIYRHKKNIDVRNAISAYNGTSVTRSRHTDYNEVSHTDEEDISTCSSLSGMGGCNPRTDRYDTKHVDFREPYYAPFNTGEA